MLSSESDLYIASLRFIPYSLSYLSLSTSFLDVQGSNGQSKLSYWILANLTRKRNNCSVLITQLLNCFLHCRWSIWHVSRIWRDEKKWICQIDKDVGDLYGNYQWYFNVSLTLIHGFWVTFQYRRMLMKNQKSTLPLSCNPTNSLCPLLSLLRHLLKSTVLFLRLFGGLERHQKLVQPDTVESVAQVYVRT